MRLGVILIACCGSPLVAATLPDGFYETLVAGGLSSPTAMEFAPDGRLFVCQQGGALRVIKDLQLLPTPFVRVTTDPTSERGLLGIAFDPGFAVNGFLYLYYTAPSPSVHNRVSRFTADGDVAIAGSEVPILELEPLDAGNHNGGAIHFGTDGKLYVAVGDNAFGPNAQTLENRLGKILRLNADGSIPSDNPFYNTATGVNRSIWALGLRNPFTFAIQPQTGRMLINDVGGGEWEEIDEGLAGANYGWPNCEGPCHSAQSIYRDPVFQYAHGSGATNGCAITGGAFYDPPVVHYPPDYVGTYFFADLCGHWIRRLNPRDGSVADFATGAAAPVDLKVSAAGRLFYLASASGEVWSIDYTNAPPALAIQRDGTGISIWWPAPSPGFVLQSAPSLPPTAGWAVVAASVLTTNGQNRVLLTVSGGAQYFRLSRP